MLKNEFYCKEKNKIFEDNVQVWTKWWPFLLPLNYENNFKLIFKNKILQYLIKLQKYKEQKLDFNLVIN